MFLTREKSYVRTSALYAIKLMLLPDGEMAGKVDQRTQPKDGESGEHAMDRGSAP